MFFGSSPRKILTYENLQQPTITYYSLKIFRVIVEADVKILWAGDCKSLTGIFPKPSAPNRSYPKLSEPSVFLCPMPRSIGTFAKAKLETWSSNPAGPSQRKGRGFP